MRKPVCRVRLAEGELHSSAACYVAYAVGRDERRAEKRADVVAGGGEPATGNRPPHPSDTIEFGEKQAHVPAAFTAVLSFPRSQRRG